MVSTDADFGVGFHWRGTIGEKLGAEPPRTQFRPFHVQLTVADRWPAR